MNISFQKLFYAIATSFSLFAIMVLAKSILIPLGFAMLIAFMLYPLVKKFESWGMNEIFATFLSLLTVFIVLGGGVYLFSTQVIDLAKDFSDFQHKIINIFSEVSVFINQNLKFIPNLEKADIINQLKTWLSGSSGTMISNTVSGTTNIFTGLFATLVFTFLILIYRTGLTRAFSTFAPERNRDKVVDMFKKVQQVGQQYSIGMGILIIIIGLANSIGLLIIGLDNPFLFGFLGAILAIIPYIGTATGALIPILYAFITYNSLGMALAVAGLFWIVQLVTDNFLSPKIVGGSMNINALTAILSLFVGAAVWGVAGMILFLPFAAMLKIICEEFEELKPIALLIGNDNYQEKDHKNSRVNKWLRKLKAKFSKSKSDADEG